MDAHKYSVRIENNGLSFYFIFFHFYFIFSYFYWKIEDKEDKLWHCHRSHMLMWYKGTM